MFNIIRLRNKQITKHARTNIPKVKRSNEPNGRPFCNETISWENCGRSMKFSCWSQSKNLHNNGSQNEIEDWGKSRYFLLFTVQSPFGHSYATNFSLRKRQNNIPPPSTHYNRRRKNSVRTNVRSFIFYYLFYLSASVVIRLPVLPCWRVGIVIFRMLNLLTFGGCAESQTNFAKVIFICF